MRKHVWTWTLLIAGAVLALGATLPAEADEQRPYRVRGTLESVESNKLTVNTREGSARSDVERRLPSDGRATREPR